MERHLAPDTGLDAGRIVSRIMAALEKAPGNTAGIRHVRRRFSKELLDVNRAIVLQVAHELIRQAPFGRFVGYELIHHHPNTMAAVTRKEIEALGYGIQSWGEVDTFSCYVAGPAWRAGRISNRVIAAWVHSDDRWWRRAALVSTVPLNARGGTGAADDTLAICRLLVQDRDDMVVKAMSWALRALGTRDPASVRTFLSEYRGTLAARVVREVENKLTTGLKSPRKE
jgi:3-methyladenine DNA glycosylase AlkD